MIDERFEGGSSQDDLDRRLQEYVKEIQQSPPQSPQRQLTLNQLVNEILKSGRLGRPQRQLWLPSIYEDLYKEALQKTLLDICQKIDNYNPSHPVLAWVNFSLNCQFIEVVNDYKKQGITQIPKSNKAEQITRLPSLDDLENLVSVEDTLSATQLLQQFIEEDPENLLKKHRLRERPDINFQSLLKARLVEGQTWLEIAKSQDVSAQTLCSFFNRQLKELMPYFRKYLIAKKFVDT